MPPATKKKAAQSKRAKNLVKLKKLKRYWKRQVIDFGDYEGPSSKGRVRSIEENYLILMSLKMLLKGYLKGKGLNMIKTINWTMLENEVAKELRVKSSNVWKIRQQFLLDGTIITCGKKATKEEKSNRGAAAESYNNRKLNREQLQSMIDEVNKRHREGKGVTNRLMRCFLKKEYDIIISATALQNYFKILGLSYKPIKCKKRNIGAYRMDMLRDFLVKLSEKYTIWKSYENPDDCPFVFVFTDESYVNKKDGVSMSYFGTEAAEFNRGSSKGDRLIILHAITPQGPLTEYDDNGLPADRIQWNGDTPHPIDPDPNENPRPLLTCETIWRASSQTGDYHSNMNSDMFMKWVKNALIPTFNACCEGKQMILVCDNAPYHHKRDLESFSSMTKEKVVENAILAGCTYIRMPMTEARHNWLIARDNVNNITVTADGLHCDVTFDPAACIVTANQEYPFIPNADELKRGRC